MAESDFDTLLQAAQQAREENTYPPVDQWQPDFSGKIDIRIDKQGKWHHEGSLIEREKLVKLFASILKKEGEDYFLVTPVEKWQIDVEDTPFFVTEVEIIESNGEQALLFTTATSDTVVADAEHPITVIEDQETGEPQPYVEVRNGMRGRLGRNVYYELASHAQPVDEDPEQYEIVSMGTGFRLV